MAQLDTELTPTERLCPAPEPRTDQLFDQLQRWSGIAGHSQSKHYIEPMSFLLRNLVRQLAQRAANDPATREKALKVARGVVSETKQIAKQDDRAYAAGKALRRALGKSRNS